uniref:ELM2 domain-containing protein n=1 Tax=Panagrolaimus sp. PS1159 TaxID=55785 RepID=A0AC35FYL5_9BILA
MDYYYTPNDSDAFDSIIDKLFFSMLKFNHLFSGLPVGRCCKAIARDFIKDNITTMEYLINPSEKNFENAIDQLKNRKYNEVNPYIQMLLKDCTINSRDTYIKCLTFRKWVIEQRRQTIKHFCIIWKKVYEEHCFVESVPSPISLNSDNICNDVAELKNVATSSSVVKFEEKETQTCQSYVDQTTQTEHIIFEEYYQNNDIESNEEEMEIDDRGYSDIQTFQITTKPSISKRILRKSTRIKEKVAAKNASNKKKEKIVAKTSEHYFECAAKIPNFQDETEAVDDSDRDECVSTPKDFKLLLKCKTGDKIVSNSSNLLTDEILEKCKIHQYFSACGTKFNGDTDSALIHLSANGYSIKKTLESIDNPDSIPMKRIHENLGIWHKNEMDAFVNYMSNNYKWNSKCKKIKKHPFWIKQFQKMFPKKSPRNCSNFYYTLKSAGFSFKEVYGISKSLPKKECLNCVKQLWKSQSEEQQVSNLYGLCKLYFELYGKQRPNAKALPLQ